MKINNGVYSKVSMRWGTFTFPVKAGTPVSASGVEANDETAVGLVPQDIAARPLTDEAYILIAGVIDPAEVLASYGTALTEDAMGAMTTILFTGFAGGGGGSDLPEVSPADAGDALVVSDAGEWTVGTPNVPIDVMAIADETKQLIDSAWFAHVSVQTGDYPPVTSDKDYEDFFNGVTPRSNAPRFAKMEYFDIDSGNTVVETCPIILDISYYMGQLEGATAYFTSQGAGVTVRWNSDGTITLD